MTTFDIELSSPGVETVGAWRTNSPIVPSLGYGGHPIGVRPKRKALTVWEGRQPFQMAVPLLLDLGRRGGELLSVEHLRAALEAMGTSVDERPPPPVKIKSNKGRLPLPAGVSENADWWIEDLQWGEEVRRGSDGELGHKEVIVTLLERIDDQLLAAKKAAVSTHRSRNYIVKKGDTLHSIAAHLFKDASLWRELGKLNGIRSDGHLKVGSTLHLPANAHYEIFGP